MSLVVKPSARERFTPRELVDAYKDFEERGPQYVNTEIGLRAAAYRFGERVLLVYEESETGVVVLIHPTFASNALACIFECVSAHGTTESGGL
jgi:hypothetical protein